MREGPVRVPVRAAPPEGLGDTGAATGIVLAGGRSTRFGSDKLAATYRGMPLLHHALLRVAEVTSEVVVVVARDAPDPAFPPGLAVRVARDPTNESEGPLAGLYAGLLAAAPADAALVTAGDMPDLQTAVLLEMLSVYAQSEADGVALHEGDGFRPLPCVLRTEAAVEASHMLLHAGRRSLRELLQAVTLAVIDEATWTALDARKATLRDVDRPEDLEALD